MYKYTCIKKAFLSNLMINPGISQIFNYVHLTENHNYKFCAMKLILSTKYQQNKTFEIFLSLDRFKHFFFIIWLNIMQIKFVCLFVIFFLSMLPYNQIDYLSVSVLETK